MRHVLMVYVGVCQVDDEVANVLVAQLLYLAQEDKEKDITLYINRYPPLTYPSATASSGTRWSERCMCACVVVQPRWVCVCRHGHL